MKHEIRFTIELSDTDSALLSDDLKGYGISLDELARNQTSSAIELMVENRKADVGRILAMTGQVDDLLRIESVKLAETRKSPW